MTVVATSSAAVNDAGTGSRAVGTPGEQWATESG